MCLLTLPISSGVLSRFSSKGISVLLTVVFNSQLDNSSIHVKIESVLILVLSSDWIVHVCFLFVLLRCFLAFSMIDNFVVKSPILRIEVD